MEESKKKEIENYMQSIDDHHERVIKNMKKNVQLFFLTNVVFVVGILIGYVYLKHFHLQYLQMTIPMEMSNRESLIKETHKFFLIEKGFDIIVFPIAVASTVMAFKIWVKK